MGNVGNRPKRFKEFADALKKEWPRNIVEKRAT